jgi:hypothetical protein
MCALNEVTLRLADILIVVCRVIYSYVPQDPRDDAGADAFCFKATAGTEGCLTGRHLVLDVLSLSLSLPSAYFENYISCLHPPDVARVVS